MLQLFFLFSLSISISFWLPSVGYGCFNILAPVLSNDMLPPPNSCCLTLSLYKQ